MRYLITILSLITIISCKPANYIVHYKPKLIILNGIVGQDDQDTTCSCNISLNIISDEGGYGCCESGIFVKDSTYGEIDLDSLINDK